MVIEKQCARLCDRCIHLFEMIEINEYGSVDPFHKDKTALEQSQNAGCCICNLLWKDGREFSGSDRADFSKAAGCINLTLESPSGAMQSKTYFQELVLFKGEDYRKLLKAFQEMIPEDGNQMDATVNLAGRLLERCLETHVDCVPNRQPSSYPYRLLDLQQDQIGLIDTREKSGSGSYATLSHTWGHADIKVLTYQNLSDFCIGLRMDEIPATFRDTIRVVRSLNIPYLWIDCYCIIQSEEPDDQEKLTEIARMGKLYSNAILNIGAISARSPLDGLFYQGGSKCECHRPTTIDLTTHDRLEPLTYLLYPALCSHDYHMASQSVFTRAWCMQERFPSSRMLHFLKHGIFWECSSVYEERLPEQIFIKGALVECTPFSPRKGTGVLPSEHLKYWNEIVTIYNTMGLSRPDKDKLAACGAVAKIMAALIGDEYVAGHFRRSLMSSLTWTMSPFNQDRGVTNQRGPVWRAPSWSWAAMDGEIDMPGHYDNNDDKGEAALQESDKSSEVEQPSKPKKMIDKPTYGLSADLVSLNIELMDPSNPYGAIKSAAMTVYGPIAEVDDHLVHSPYRPGWKSCVRWGENQIDVTLDDPNEARLNLSILLTRIRRRYMPSSGDMPMAPGCGPLPYGLVLVLFQKGSEGQPDVYRRIGAFREQWVATSQQSGRYGCKLSAFYRPERKMIMIV